MSSDRYEWWWLNGEQRTPINVQQWVRYEPQVSYHLSASYSAMLAENSAEKEGLVLDLEAWTDPPLGYQIWRGREVEVRNSKAGQLTVGQHAIAGYPKELWKPGTSQLPASAKDGIIQAGFYQVRKDHVKYMKKLDEFIGDSSCPDDPFPEPPRRRVVILIVISRPAFIFGADRFRSSLRRIRSGIKGNKPEEKQIPIPIQNAEHDSIPQDAAVFQWWWGDPEPGGVGHWKNYHPHISAKLEQAFATNQQFRNCETPIEIDPVRYMLQRITKDHPFDYRAQSENFREPFLAQHVTKVDYFLFDDQARILNHCFVQFQRGNPKRRRPVRRVRRGEAAGVEMPDGEPCGVCFSDTGFMTGCQSCHIVCSSCTRMGLRIAAGDITVTENLVCGCLSSNDDVALGVLAEKADATLQELLKNPPADKFAKREFDAEVEVLVQAFQLDATNIPSNLFRSKLDEWHEKVRQKSMEHLYYACSHPGCKMSNWVLRADLDEHRMQTHSCTWFCLQGHQNTLLPPQSDIDEMNRNLLYHPEYYFDCGEGKLRKFRICPECLQEGFLTLAEHEHGCKQWPGNRKEHRHCYCFHCTQPWGTVCRHGNRCKDPGIQQVRIKTDASGKQESLEVGYVNSEKYLKWVAGKSKECPPTVFPSGPLQGSIRQSRLGLENIKELDRISRQGITAL